MRTEAIPIPPLSAGGLIFSYRCTNTCRHCLYLTGLCAGLSPATVEDLHPPMTPDSHPIFWRLAREGPFGLMKEAEATHGFQERESGYVSQCDLCLDVRTYLQENADGSELRPASFYMDDAEEGGKRL